MASAPSGRSIGRNVTTPPPASVTTNSTADGASDAWAARRPAPRPRDGTSGDAVRNSAGRKNSPSSGEAASHASQPTCPARTSATPAGTATRLGTAMARPYSPIDSPRRSGGATAAASRAPRTVMTPKPTPRTADSQEIHSRPSSSAYSGAGSPIATSPAASTGPVPRRAVREGTAACEAIVTTRKTAVTTPAVASAAPPSTAYVGREASVRQ